MEAQYWVQFSGRSRFGFLSGGRFRGWTQHSFFCALGEGGTTSMHQSCPFSTLPSYHRHHITKPVAQKLLASARFFSTTATSKDHVALVLSVRQSEKA